MQKIFDSQTPDSIKHYGELQSYLKTKMELIEPEVVHPPKGPPKATEVKITASNTAPSTIDGPSIVFTGVALYVGHIGGNIQTLKPHLIKQEKVENSEKPPDIKYICVSGPNNSKTPDNDKQQGEILLPGQSITYEMFVPSQMIPYLQFRVKGNISLQHLYHCQNTIAMPEKYTRPVALATLKDFNNLAIYEVFENIINTMPKFNTETRLGDVQIFTSLISLKMIDIKKTQDALNELFKKHNIYWFHGLLKATHLYLEHLKIALLDMKNAISTNKTDEIEMKYIALKSLENEEYQLNKMVKDLIEKNKLSDEEVNYKFRIM